MKRRTTKAAAMALALCALAAAGFGAAFATGESAAQPQQTTGTTTGTTATTATTGTTATTAPTDKTRIVVNRFNAKKAHDFVEQQVRLGPRPAGSRASRRLSAILRESIPNGRFQRVPGGLRNVIGAVRGKNPRRVVVVGAHYDTVDIPGFVGANDGASGTAVVRQLARTIKGRTLRPTVVFAFFDGEEAPPGTPDGQFEQRALRGSKVAARVFRNAEAMILLDMVGDRRLVIPREQGSDARLWARLRRAATRVGARRVFPPRTTGEIIDDHVPFRRAGVPSIDVIDFDFPCWHRRCDRLAAVSAQSLDYVGETVLELCAASRRAWRNVARRRSRRFVKPS